MKLIVLFAFPIALAAAADARVYLETTPGSTLTIEGPLDSTPAVDAAPMRRTQNQRWSRNADGTWRSAQDAAYCLAFQGVSGSGLTVRPCSDLLAYRDSKRETTRDIKFKPTRDAAVDTSSRDAVLAFYNAQYSPGNPPPDAGFTGDVAGCVAGTTNPAYRAAVTQRVNFMRNIAGLADAALDDALSTLAQSSALMQAANQDLSHTPPATWKCFTDVGAQASAKSNLSLGNIGWDAIVAYVNEDGVLGHRRWVLFPRLQRFGTGDVPSTPANRSGANALYVITGDAPPAAPQIRDGFVAWPPKGFVPYKLAYPTWSFSVPNGDFSAATVVVTDGAGAAVAVNGASELQRNFGDNTYSFQPTLAATRPTPGGPDIPITVTINNVMVNGAAQNYTYTVTLIDVVDPPTDIQTNGFNIVVMTPLPAGAAFVNLTVKDGGDGSGYTFTLVAGDGSDDNALFNVNRTTLAPAADLDLTAKAAYKVRLKADNGRPGGTIEKAVTIASPFAQ